MNAERIRTAWARLRRRERADSADVYGEPWTTALAGLQSAATEIAAPPAPEPVGAGERFRSGRTAQTRAEPSEDASMSEDATTSTELITALHRVAESFERVAESLDADRSERRDTLGDLDSLLRELVSGLRSPTAAGPVVIGGTIDVTGADVDLRPQPEPR